MDTIIKWNRAKLRKFRRRFAKAVLEKEEVFEFEGHELLRDYAAYLIEYLVPNLEATGVS